MRGYVKAALILLSAALITPPLSVRALALGDSSVNTSPCSIAAGGDASNNNLTCNDGPTPEQLRELTKAVESANALSASLAAQLVDISKQLGVTQAAAKTLLHGR